MPAVLGTNGVAERTAGVVFNMILAFLVTTAQVSNVGYTEATYDPGVRVPIVMQNSAAQRYGVLPGDVILALDNEDIASGAVGVVLTNLSARSTLLTYTIRMVNGHPVPSGQARLTAGRATDVRHLMQPFQSPRHHMRVMYHCAVRDRSRAVTPFTPTYLSISFPVLTHIRAREARPTLVL
jgi:hypothetical protein